MVKKILWIVLLILIICGGYAAYLWFKPHRDIVNEEAEHAMESGELLRQYRADERAANTLYLDKVIIVRGDIIEIDDKHIKLSEGVYCNGNFSLASVGEGETVAIKGRVVGYDELFEEVRMDNCSFE